MPQFDPNHIGEAAMRGYADVAAERLAVFSNSLNLSESTAVVPIGHSYGVVALAQAEAIGLRADRVIYVAPAGVGEEAGGVSDFPATADVPHFSLQARNDAIVGISQGVLSGLGLGHGFADPVEGADITRLETGFLDEDHPAKGTIEETNDPVESHTAVFTPGSTSMRNIANVVTGEPVSLYHPDTSVRTGGPRNLEVPGSGARQPEEFISPLTLEEVEE